MPRIPSKRDNTPKFRCAYRVDVYKDLAEEYGTTIGQILMLSYNYSSSASSEAGSPSIGMAINCTALFWLSFVVNLGNFSHSSID